MKVIFILFMFLFSTSVCSEIYKWTDENGKLHFTDKPTNRINVETVELSRINTFKGVVVETSTSKIKKSHKKKSVVMYSTDWCGVCKRAKAYFKANHIAYRDYDIDKNKRAYKKYKQLKGRGVPLILVGGKKMHGFSVAGFQQLYSQ